MKKRMIRCALMVSSLWFFCGCRSLFPLNDDPVVTHSASEDDANVISEENVVNPVEVPEGVSMYCSSPSMSVPCQGWRERSSVRWKRTSVSR